MEVSTVRRLAALLVLAALVAPSAAWAADEPSPAEGAPMIDPNITATVEVWSYLPPEQFGQVLDDWQTLLQQQYPNVSVSYQTIPFAELTNKLIGSAAANQGPDIIVTNGAYAPQLADVGAVLPLDSYWANYADADQFSEAVMASVDGALYAVQSYTNLLALYYNQDLLDELGLQPPTTYDELESAMAAAKDAGYSGMTVSGKPDLEGEWQAKPWFAGYGYDYETNDAAALTSAFDRIGGWVDAGYIPKESSGWGQADAMTTWLAGETLFTENGNWETAHVADAAEFNYGVVPMPAGPDGRTIYLGGEFQYIGAFSENPDLAWAFLEAGPFSVDGQLAFLNDNGGIPTRMDAATADVLGTDPVLSGFAESVAFGTPLPAGEEIAAAQQALAEQWSALLAGAKSGADAAQAAVTGVREALQ